MQWNTDPLIMMPDSTAAKPVHICIILCATSFNQEKGDNLVKDPDFLSKLTQFIENTRDQMVDYQTILNLASDFISSVDQYPLTTAVVAPRNLCETLFGQKETKRSYLNGLIKRNQIINPYFTKHNNNIR